METIRSFIRERPRLVSIVSAFVLGALFGLIVLGWYVFPVRWYDTDPEDLRLEHQEEYLELIADSYAQTSDLPLAIERVRRLQGARRSRDEIVEMMNRLAEKRRKEGRFAEAQRISVLAAAISLPTPTPSVAVSQAVKSSGVRTRVKAMALPLLVIVLVVLGGALLFVYLRRRPYTVSLPKISRMLPRKRPIEAVEELEEVEEVSEEEFAPFVYTPPTEREEVFGAELGRFRATYNLGDDDFDASFGLEGPGGDFLGECGIGIRETLDAEGPRRVTAFEVWLFDKQDIRTVIGMLASEYAYQDEKMRAALSARGEVVLARPGAVIDLETVGLRLHAGVREVSYGQDPDLPSRSFFSKLVVDLYVDAASSEET